MLNTALIKSTMRKLGLSQGALAERCNVSKEAVSNWLSGESVPRPNKIKALGEALSLPVDDLFVVEEAFPEPVVAYRTSRNRAVTGPAREAAEDLARHLQELVPFIQREALFAPPVLEAPRLDDDYIQEAAKQVRARIGLTPKAALTRAQLLELHREFGSLLVPVLWSGTKAGHENALSVYLPDSKTSWVVFSLNARNDDFNYWLAHELGHCYSLHALRGDEGEEFSERFAQELLFPVEAAADALEDIVADRSRKERAAWYAGKHDISIVTVIKQVDRVARLSGKPITGLDTPAFWRAWNVTRSSVPTVVEVMFGTRELSAEEYVLKCEDQFNTPVFRALAQWQGQAGGRSPAFISAALNISVGQAVELSHFLMKLYGFPSESVDSPNSC